MVEIGTTNTKVLLFEHSWHSSGISCYRFTVVPSFVPRAMDVQIISPVDGSTVPWEVSIEGTSSGVPDNSSIWGCVLPPNMRYYPQPAPATKSLDGRWHATAFVGQEPAADVGKLFVIIALVSDGEANEELLEYVRVSESTGRWLGIPSLPTGAYLCHEVKVVRD